METTITDIMEELIDKVQEYSDSSYDLNSSIEESKIILEDEMRIHQLSKCEFKENKWYIELPLESKRASVDFNTVKKSIQFNKKINTTEFINIVKCWTASLINQGYNSTVIVQMVHEGLRSFLNLTNGFTSNNYEEIAEEFAAFSNRRKNTIRNSILNFFDYYNDYPIEIEEYISMIYSFKVINKVEARLLPPSKDILFFSKLLEDYFSNEMSDLEYRKWFPVWLWWNLTTLIPIRPSEYCNIDRDCIFKKGDNYYIKLPRHKQKLNNKRNIQILNEVRISEKLYSEIEKYKHRTASYGRTETLISYLSMPNIVNGEYVENVYYHTLRLKPYKFSLTLFRNNLSSFYKHIVFLKYKVRLDKNESSKNTLSCISQQLRVGDTRHLAFINLKRQGYHPTEIARLGGHVTLQTQNHYFNHIQSFVDLEVLELITNSDLDSYKHKIDSDFNHEQQISMSFIEKYVLRPSQTNFKMKMIDGYCTDPHQRCKVEDCWQCTSWRISEEEFIEKRCILERKLSDSESELNNVIENLKDLYKGIYANIGKDEFYSNDNNDIRKELINKSKRIDNAVRKYVNLAKVKERIELIGNKG
ncbi:hypothetical protein [Solibacillus sp. FSL H8-0538]|uniref:hypothetical protein n=1 Tax=Solibacillus sp. FSL H8-0538 TaxID=2921400 RepID=UPI0030FCC099